MHNFRMRGYLRNTDNLIPNEVLYKNGRLYGDKELVKALKAEVTDIKDATEVILSMRDLCRNGQIWGRYPDWNSVGEDEK